MKPTKQTKPTPEDAVIASAASHYQSAQAALRKGCAEALITGLHLVWLHGHSVEMGGDRRSISVPRGTLIKGYEAALEKIGIARRTAYRWMDATYKACLRLGYIEEGEELSAILPAPASAGWKKWEKGLEELSEGMSLNRLMLGNSQPSTEEHRFDELITATEEGRQRASDLLEGVAEGRYTLVQAVRALGSLEAYDALRAGGGEKVRRDPIYLSMDGATGHLDGLFVKSLTTLRNTFTHWDDTPTTARKKARELWLETIESMPADLKNG